MTGRTVLKWSKVYIDGYDLTGYSRTFGPLSWTLAEDDSTVLNDPVKNAIAGQPMANVGTINAVLDNTTGASHDRLSSAGTRVITLPIGFRTNPVAGDPAFCGEYMQKEHMGVVSNGVAVTISAAFSGYANDAVVKTYGNPWGVVIAPKATKTAANTATGIDDRGASSSLGGYAVFHLFSSDGAVTLSVQDADTNSNGSFADLVSSGSIDASSTPVGVAVALANDATVEQYLRWQLDLGGSSTATFAIAFVRA